MSEVQIDALLKELNESNRQVFKYKVFYNLTYQEISSVMGITEVNVRKQFERARKRVQNMIEVYNMTNSKNSKEIYELAEKIALDDFDKLEEQHEFSHTYTRKKEIVYGGNEAERRSHRKSVKTSYVNRCCLLIDWYADNRFGAVKVYNMIVQNKITK